MKHSFASVKDSVDHRCSFRLKLPEHAISLSRGESQVLFRFDGIVGVAPKQVPKGARIVEVNAGGGRDHWPRVFSIVMVGGSIKRGQIYGASDALAAEPADNPLGVEDYITTVYHLLGIDAAKSLMSPGDRPQPIVTNGKVVQGLLA